MDEARCSDAHHTLTLEFGISEHSGLHGAPEHVAGRLPPHLRDLWVRPGQRGIKLLVTTAALGPSLDVSMETHSYYGVVELGNK